LELSVSAKMVLSYNRRTSAALVILSIVVLEMLLISDQIKPTYAMKKKKLKKLLKKLGPILSLLSLLKGKKTKIIPLPIPLPLPL